MLAIKHQSETEIYISSSGYLVIKQDADDSIITISSNNIELFLLNLQSVINGEDE